MTRYPEWKNQKNNGYEKQVCGKRDLLGVGRNDHLPDF